MFSAPYFEPWKKYQTPIVRQLAFCIASPNLIHHFPPQIDISQPTDFFSLKDWKKFYLSYEHRLNELDQAPAPLLDFLQQIKSTRLGLRFEALLWFWLQDSQNIFFELLGHSIQSHYKGKTLGEIDFLVKNRETQQIEHWEVCLKYYLSHADLKLENWIGLNPDDTFLHKLQHLVQHQFQFSTALGFTIDKRVAIVKGQLYLPPQHAALPDWLNQERRTGFWQSSPPSTPNYRRLTRKEWLCPHLQEPPPHTIRWWCNGLYYSPTYEQFMMLRLTPPTYPYLR